MIEDDSTQLFYRVVVFFLPCALRALFCPLKACNGFEFFEILSGLCGIIERVYNLHNMVLLEIGVRVHIEAIRKRN